MLLLIAIVVIVCLLSALPCWGFHRYGWYPVSALGLLLLLGLLWILWQQR